MVATSGCGEATCWPRPVQLVPPLSEKAPSTTAVVWGTGLKLDKSTPQTAKSFWESYGSITTAGLFALPFVVTLESPVRFTGAPVAVAAGIVASSVRDSRNSLSRKALRRRVFRLLLSRASGRTRPRNPRDETSDAPVRMTVSPD